MKFKVGELVRIHTKIRDNSVLSRLRKKGYIFRLVEQEEDYKQSIVWKCAIVYRGWDEEHKEVNVIWLYEDELQRLVDNPSLVLLLRD